MKFFKSVILTLLGGMSTCAFASDQRALQFECFSKGGRSERDMVLKIVGILLSATEISDVTVSEKTGETPKYFEVISKNGSVEADQNYNPTNPKYKVFNRFEISKDSVDTFQIFFPRIVTLATGSKLNGFLRTAFDRGAGVMRSISCDLK